MHAAAGLHRPVDSEDDAEDLSVSKASEEAEERRSRTSTDFDSSDFDRLLEAASSGGMSDTVKSGSGGVLEGMDLQGPTRRLNSTVTSNSTNPRGFSGQNLSQPLAETMQRLNLTATLNRAQARQQASLVSDAQRASARDHIDGNAHVKSSVTEPGLVDPKQDFSSGADAADTTQLIKGFTD